LILLQKPSLFIRKTTIKPRISSIYRFGIFFAFLFVFPDISKFTFKRRVLKMSEENSTGSNFIWAVTLIIIVAIIAGALYYSGFLGGTKKEKIDINVTAPSAPSSR
jgi:hypothetical protein